MHNDQPVHYGSSLAVRTHTPCGLKVFKHMWTHTRYTWRQGELNRQIEPDWANRALIWGTRGLPVCSKSDELLQPYASRVRPWVEHKGRDQVSP